MHNASSIYPLHCEYVRSSKSNSSEGDKSVSGGLCTNNHGYQGAPYPRFRVGRGLGLELLGGGRVSPIQLTQNLDWERVRVRVRIVWAIVVCGGTFPGADCAGGRGDCPRTMMHDWLCLIFYVIPFISGTDNNAG